MIAHHGYVTTVVWPAKRFPLRNSPAVLRSFSLLHIRCRSTMRLPMASSISLGLPSEGKHWCGFARLFRSGGLTLNIWCSKLELLKIPRFTWALLFSFCVFHNHLGRPGEGGEMNLNWGIAAPCWMWPKVSLSSMRLGEWGALMGAQIQARTWSNHKNVSANIWITSGSFLGSCLDSS